MDLIAYGTLMLGFGYYVNNNSFESYKNRPIKERTELLPNEAIQGSDNAYRKTLFERSDEDWRKKGLEHIQMLHENGIDDPLSGPNDLPYSSAYDNIPANNRKYTSYVKKGYDFDKLMEFKRSENFLDSDPTNMYDASGNVDRTTAAVWNGPDRFAVDPTQIADDKQRELAMKNQSPYISGVPLFEPTYVKPITEEIRIMPQTSAQMRTNGFERLDVAELPFYKERIPLVAPPSMPENNKRLETTHDYEENGFNSMNKSSSVQMKPLMGEFTLKDKWNRGKMNVNENFTRNLQTEVQKNATRTLPELRKKITNKFNPMKHSSLGSEHLLKQAWRANPDLKGFEKKSYAHFGNIDGLQGTSRPEDPHVKRTLKETLLYDGRLHSQFSGVLKGSMNAEDMDAPRKTNREMTTEYTRMNGPVSDVPKPAMINVEMKAPKLKDVKGRIAGGQYEIEDRTPLKLREPKNLDSIAIIRGDYTNFMPQNELEQAELRFAEMKKPTLFT